jgi:hypothetical protein
MQDSIPAARSADGASVWYSAQLTSARTEIRCPLQASNDLTEELEQPTSDRARLAWARSELGTTGSAPYRLTM